TVCHQGRGWSTDFGLAYHAPPLRKVDDWMTTARAEAEGHRLPLTARQTLEEAMAKGHSGTESIHAGYALDRSKAESWQEDLGRTEGKLKYWHWPQLPKMLVQSSCLKCHREGLYAPPEEEYAHVRFGPPVELDEELEDAQDLYSDQLESFRNREAAGEPDRLLIPADRDRPAGYRPEALRRGLDNFLRFGCYGCHKLDAKLYPFMDEMRPKVGPPLDPIAAKTTESFLLQWVYNPKAFRPGTRMPRFWGLSNNSHDFRYRFADPESGFDEVNGRKWGQSEAYAIVQWILHESRRRDVKYPAVDLGRGDAGRGQRIVVGDSGASDGDAKACIACHDIPIRDQKLKVDFAALGSWAKARTGETYGWRKRMSRRQGPDLAGIGSKVRPEWLVAWLKNPRGVWHDTLMPDLRLSDQDALDVAAYLMTLRHREFEALPPVVGNQGFVRKIAEELKVAERSEPTRRAIAAVAAMTPEERLLYVGKKLVKHYGCFGCHQIEAHAAETPVGTELTEWGSKLIERLEWNHLPVDHEKSEFPYARFQFAYAKLRNPRIYDLGMPRADLPYARLKMPHFGLTSDEARDIATFLVGLVNDPISPAAAFHLDEQARKIWKGRHVVRRYNCQGCHIIEGEGGDIWPAIPKKLEKWRPPDLRGQGLKTSPDWLFRFLREPYTVRPWHSIHMPTFGLTDEEDRALVAYFTALSRAPYPFEQEARSSLVGAAGEPIPIEPKELELKDLDDPTKLETVTVRNRLEEARALFREYQCQSCHSTDPSVPIGNRAPSFEHTRNGRLRHPWLRIWLWDPGKLQEGTAMPAFYDKGKPQDVQFFGNLAAEQIRALADYVRYHYSESDR
ncbi:MAG: c-type cytochrome, partial [Planctomycetota bacterium]